MKFMYFQVLFFHGFVKIWIFGLHIFFKLMHEGFQTVRFKFCNKFFPKSGFIHSGILNT